MLPFVTSCNKSRYLFTEDIFSRSCYVAFGWQNIRCRAVEGFPCCKTSPVTQKCRLRPEMDWEIFSDSPTAKGMICGQTKAKALCGNVLGPNSVQIHTDYISGNRRIKQRCFPIVPRYFHFEENIQHALLDFYSDSTSATKILMLLKNLFIIYVTS